MCLTRPVDPPWFAAIDAATGAQIAEILIRLAWPTREDAAWRAWATEWLAGEEDFRKLWWRWSTVTPVFVSRFPCLAALAVQAAISAEQGPSWFVRHALDRHCRALHIDPSPVIDAVLMGEGWRLGQECDP